MIIKAAKKSPNPEIPKAKEEISKKKIMLIHQLN